MSNHQIRRRPVGSPPTSPAADSTETFTTPFPPPPPTSAPPPPPGPPPAPPTDLPPAYSDSVSDASPAAAESSFLSKEQAAAYNGSYSHGEGSSGSQRQTSSNEKATLGAHEQPPSTDEAPPPYSEQLGVIESEAEGTQAAIADDGRVNININQLSRRLSTVFAPALHRQFTEAARDEPLPPPYIPPSLGGEAGKIPPPPMNVVIHVVGSRGDVQPFVALGKVLKDTYKHRVRLATHPVFKKFVEENGLEFFSIGGDPADLMAFMVKNPGLMPGFDSLRNGEVGKHRKVIAEMIRGCWRSCIETGDGFGVEASDSTVEDWSNNNSWPAEDLAQRPFVADAIIANPPSFAHIHCAERLGIPLHMMFTMPWSPTQQFPHPLANIQSSNADPKLTNFMSYTIVEMMTWQGLGDVINRFRHESLGLEPISLLWAPGMLARQRIPWTYCWSPALIPKPKDWANFITISGFYFLNLATNYTPEPALAEFLAAGPPPVYIGFGSIVVDDPNAMTNLIFEAVRKTGQRALVSKGWGGFGADELDIPPGVFMLGNVPHDWLFKHVSCVVHHGGAGTTAAGIACGRPTVIVPFFGDQPFWGSMVARAGAGPEPIHHKNLTADKLAEAINKALEPATKEKAQQMADTISRENGCEVGAQNFHQLLKVDELRCAVAPSRIGFWRLKRTTILLSGLAATVLAQAGEIQFSDLKMHRPREYEPDEGPWDPISGGSTAIIGTFGQVMMGVADFPKETLRALRIHPDASKSKGKGKGKAKDNGSGNPSQTGLNRPDTATSGSSSDARAAHGALSPSITIDSTESIPKSLALSDTSNTSSIERSNFMAQAMQQRGGSHSPGSRSRAGSAAHIRSPSQDKRPSMTVEAVAGTGKGIGRIVGAGLKSPMDFSLAIAKGFHNASRLYGEEPRKVSKVTDLESGLKVSGKEFALGLYDGITGLVKDPYRGAKKEGAVGFVKGFGKGIAGVALKPGAAMWSLPAYTFKGIYKEICKPFGPSVENYIIAARTAQGYDDFVQATEQEKADILQRWRCIKPTIKKKKNPGQDQLDALNSMLEKHREKRKEKAKDPRISRPSPHGLFASNRSQSGTGSHGVYLHPGSNATATSFSSNQSVGLPPNHTELPGSEPSEFVELPAQRLSSENPWPEYSSQQHRAATIPMDHPTSASTEDQDLEAALQRSLSDTTMRSPNTTSPDEDELIERAIQASINELSRNPPSSSPNDEEEALQRALAASMEEASRNGATDEEARQLEEVLRRSMVETTQRTKWEKQQKKQKRVRSSDSEWDSSSDDDTESLTVLTPVGDRDTDAGFNSTAPTSVVSPSVAGRDDDDDDEDEEEQLRRALEMSMQVEDEKQKERSEEEIVMEYVKKMSLAEEEHRRRMMQGREGPRASAGEGGSGT